jgi:hypothetical protein
MTQTNTAQEEVTTIQSPQQIVRKTTKQAEPQAKGEAPQTVYEKKKTIFRSTQVVWYVLGLVETLLVFRIFLKMLGANSSIGFTNFIYSLTSPLASPFSGILGLSISGASVIEWSTIIASIVYLCIAWGLIYLLEIVYPITPKDIGTE